MKRIALATATEALPLDGDMPPLLAACADLGLRAEAVCWDDPQARWADFDAVVLRSTWDYVPRLPRFLIWAETVARQTRLFNPRELVRWSTDKHYLADLAQAGVPVVPTAFVEPGEDVRAALESALGGRFGASRIAPPDEFVAKPAVGAGSKDALRLGRREGERARLHVEGADAVDGLFAPEDIRARELDKEEGRVAKLAFNAVPGDVPLYARVDLLRGAEGQPVVLELELVEPSLFFDCDPGAARRFAEALRDRLG